MSVLVETSLGNIVIDLHVADCPVASRNFLKLCKIKYYNNCLFHNVQRNYLIQAGDPTGTGKGGSSVYGVVKGEQFRYFDDEIKPHLLHKKSGCVGMASRGPGTNASQFYITTGDNLTSLDEKHTLFGVVAEGMEVVMAINNVYTGKDGRPLQNVRVRHTFILEDPFPDVPGMIVPDASPIPEKDIGSLEIDDVLEEEPDPEKKMEILQEKEARSRAEVLEIVQDIPFAEIAPPEHVLFVCKLNPVTREEDLELIFSRFGRVVSCEVIRDHKTSNSLCYAFIEFENKEQCVEAYAKMDNVLVDDRRIHVDFSQSVAKHGIMYNFRRKQGRWYPTAPLAGMPGVSQPLTGNLAWSDKMTRSTKNPGKKYDFVTEDSQTSEPRKRGPESPAVGSGAKRPREDRERAHPGDRVDKPRAPRDSTKETGGTERERPRDGDRHTGRDRDRDREREREREGRERERDRDRGRDRDSHHHGSRHESPPKHSPKPTAASPPATTTSSTSAGKSSNRWDSPTHKSASPQPHRHKDKS
ncbi:peptidyl-prolyl cis-trans isomerase CYP59 [Pelomyxa schiedti]|nr:peptidyl-prolyl cis-trans isomerase CYP59 [Pelomyxa schiedti]